MRSDFLKYQIPRVMNNFCFLLSEIKNCQIANPTKDRQLSITSHWFPKSPKGPSDTNVISRDKA